jgi:DNA-binding beta-propeller fold protein YncE
MPLKALREVVEGSEYLEGGWASGVVERKEAAGDNGYEVEYREGRRYDLGDGADARMVALDGEEAGQRMAVVDYDNECVMMFDVESGERVATAGSEGRGPGQFSYPAGVAFSGTGELYVSDYVLDRISVFDREGRYVRGFGGQGQGQGQFRNPFGLCFTADGDLVVADASDHRVQVFREDGTFVRAIGSRGSGEGQFDHPRDVCCRPDGSIAVLENGNRRVQVFDEDWGFVRSFGSMGEGPGQFLNPQSITAGGGGEIIVADLERKDVQVFSGEGELLQIIGPKGDSKVAWRGYPFGVVSCGDGRLFVSDGDSVVLLS